MTAKQLRYWKRVLDAVLAREEAGPEPPVAAGEALLKEQARVAELELELREHDERLGKVRAEYDALESRSGHALVQVGQDEVERLLKKLTGPLSNLVAVAALAEAGQAVPIADLVTLIRGLEKELARAGLKSIGKTGAQTGFDVAEHQRMSGGAVRQGTPVTVRLPGFRLGEKVLLKAMVSAREDPVGQGGG